MLNGTRTLVDKNQSLESAMKLIFVPFCQFYCVLTVNPLTTPN